MLYLYGFSRPTRHWSIAVGAFKTIILRSCLILLGNCSFLRVHPPCTFLRAASSSWYTEKLKIGLHSRRSPPFIYSCKDANNQSISFLKRIRCLLVEWYARKSFKIMAGSLKGGTTCTSQMQVFNTEMKVDVYLQAIWFQQHLIWRPQWSTSVDSEMQTSCKHSRANGLKSIETLLARYAVLVKCMIFYTKLRAASFPSSMYFL